jgi:hypothetical protein
MLMHATPAHASGLPCSHAPLCRRHSPHPPAPPHRTRECSHPLGVASLGLGLCRARPREWAVGRTHLRRGGAQSGRGRATPARGSGRLESSRAREAAGCGSGRTHTLCSPSASRCSLLAQKAAPSHASHGKPHSVAAHTHTRSRFRAVCTRASVFVVHCAHASMCVCVRIEAAPCAVWGASRRRALFDVHTP